MLLIGLFFRIFYQLNVDCMIFTARRYACAIYAVVVYPSVRLSITSRRSTKTANNRDIVTTEG